MNQNYFCLVFTHGIQLFQHHLLKRQSFLYLIVPGGGLVAKLCLTHVTPWTVAHWAPLFMGFPRQKYWSGLPFPSPGDVPSPGITLPSPALAVDSLPLSHQRTLKKIILTETKKIFYFN